MNVLIMTPVKTSVLGMLSCRRFLDPLDSLPLHSKHFFRLQFMLILGEVTKHAGGWKLYPKNIQGYTNANTPPSDKSSNTNQNNLIAVAYLDLLL